MPRLLSKSWLDSYLEYQENTENPKDYNLWAGLSVLSSALKRQVFMHYRGFKLYPNQYIILVGPAGIGKGSAINPAADIAEEAGVVNYIKDKITPEELINQLNSGFAKTVPTSPGANTFSISTDHNATVLALEFPVFLASHESMHSILCAFWDQGKFVYGTKNKGRYAIDNLGVSLIGGCVPDFVRSLSRDRMAPITGGFTARTIWVYAMERDKLIPDQFDAPSQITSDLKFKLINDIKHISSLNGVFTIDAKAKALWISKYAEHNSKQTGFDSDATSTFRSRISTHILKSALAISVSESDSLIITENQLARAITIIEGVRDKVDIVFRCIGESPVAVSQDKIRGYIEANGLVSRSVLLKHFYRDVTDEQLTIVLYTLKMAGIIEEDIQGNKLYYKSLI